MIAENPEYYDQGNYEHLANIFTALALYEIERDRGCTEDEATGKRLRFECTSCIYQQIYDKYGIRRLGTIFCHADVVNYGSIPGVTFTRNHTLYQDGKPCDFLFTK